MKKIIVILLLIIPAITYCQDAENSPYSRYGLGDFINPSYSGFRAMGNTSIAIQNRFHVNLGNPASIGELGTTSFEVATSAKKSTYTEGNNSIDQWSGNIDYLAIGFPLKNPINELYEAKRSKYKLGMAFGLNKFTRLSYNVVGTDSTANIGNITRSYNGNGGTYKFQWANAISTKNFSFGVSLGYLFGGIQRSRSIVFEDLEFAFDDMIDSEYHLKGLAVKTGLIYNLYLNEKQAADNPSIGLKKLSIGLTYDLPTRFSTSRESLERSVQTLINGAIVSDTISNDTVSGKGKIPGMLGLGVAFYNGEKAAYTAEVKIGNWSNYYNEATGETAGTLNNSLSVGLGGYYRPNYKSFTSFWKRAYYKYGFYYEKDPRVIVGEPLTKYGVTVGTTLPFVFQRKVAHADIGFDFGKSGTGTIIEEKYFKINFGFTFNDDDWFIKRKYN